IRHRPRGDRRFRRPSRQRHAGHLLARPDRDVLLDAQMPLFPGTGASGERGEHDTIVNAPLASEDGGAKFRSAFENLILPQLQKFAPELIIISAGFDAHYRDPLASLNLKADDFSWVTRKLMDQAEASAGGRVVSVLEGGYDLQGLKESVAAHVTTLMGA